LSRTIPAVLLVAIIILVAAFGYYYEQSSNATFSLSQTISSQSSQLVLRAAQVAADDSKMDNLTSTVHSLQSRVASLQSQVRTDEANISSLIAESAQANTTITSLDSKITSLTKQVSVLNSQIAGLNGRIAAYQSQIATLQLQVRQFQDLIESVDGALAEPTAQLLYSNANLSVGTGSEKNLTFTATSNGGVFLVAISSSTSSNTTIYCEGEPAQIGVKPVNVGSSGIAACTPEEGDTFTIQIYDQNLYSLSAAVNIWYFS
jgi:peptidoglycan hydrolase CwlO-like protein